MKPILFNTEMVQAILQDRKTVTRRVIKRRETNPNPSGYGFWKEFKEDDQKWYIKSGISKIITTHVRGGGKQSI